ncbi:MAG TPA: dipeptide ABC transporter ATP-binding protein [Oligoflexia bacterium]|nr:dipeptide ABC transporter ATP-binding protein [Oligoflexia bacterium]HMR24550.1 dipeptide ABC transporter ATP-binding protein [Oligoflexia bacterium]
MSENILKVEDLKVHFKLRQKGIFGSEVQTVKAVDGVSFEVKKGETLGLVGESGCGKSTLGRAILQLIQPTSGKVFFENQEITAMKNLQKMRRKMQIIFQDPYASLNPRMTVESIISEPLKTFNVAQGSELTRKVQELMEMVGLRPQYIRRYPHEFSGGQRQRIGIARAIALNPDLIIADEPISALDVSIQAQILNLMQDLQKELNLTYVFIAHDLAAVRHISDRVAVMYLGKLAEIGTADEIIKNPQHPYTKALISAIPIPDPQVEKNKQKTVLQGDVPSPLNPPKGCRFHTRCPIAKDVCKQEIPLLEHKVQRMVACHLV